MTKRYDTHGWRCAVKQRAYSRQYRQRSTASKDRYNRLKAAGMCTVCGKDVSITETRCFDCAQKMDESNMSRIR